MKSFQCDFLRKDGHTVRSVRFLAPDREVAMLEAAKLLSWLAPRERSGGMIVRDGTTILAWLDGTS